MKVKARIDGRPVQAEIILNPWNEAARAFRRLAEVMSRLRFEDRA